MEGLLGRLVRWAVVVATLGRRRQFPLFDERFGAQRRRWRRDGRHRRTSCKKARRAVVWRVRIFQSGGQGCEQPCGLLLLLFLVELLLDVIQHRP